MNRRPFLMLGLGAAWSGPVFASRAQQNKDPLLVGVEQSLFDTMLAPGLASAFTRETRLTVKLVPQPSALALRALELGDVDVSLTNAPLMEQQLLQRGLAHDAHPVASGDWVLVGPRSGPAAQAQAAALNGTRGMAHAYQALIQHKQGVVPAADGSGADFAERAFLQSARLDRPAQWTRVREDKNYQKLGALAYAGQEGNGVTLIESALWTKHPQRNLKVLLTSPRGEGGTVTVMRGFRSQHPVAKLFVKWVSTAGARSVPGRIKGWNAPIRPNK